MEYYQFKPPNTVERPYTVAFGFTLTRPDRLGNHARYWTGHVVYIFEYIQTT